MSDERRFNGLEVAVVGMAGRFPGARDVDELWRNLVAGVESVRRFSDAELDAEGVPAEVRREPGFVAAGAVLDDVERFDARFFGYGPREAEILDPQHRLFLEWCWQALEDAGCDPRRDRRPVGVWGGTDVNTYLLFHLLGNRELVRLVGAQQLRYSNRPDTLATRVAYQLDLTGPAITVQTTCSTSLVAVHLACQSLLNGECDMALAGGVSVDVGQRQGYLARAGGVLSPDGHTRAFDAAAAGMVSGNGGGVVALKRLDDARADGDRVLALIKGSAVNNDGARKVGYTAPGVDGQARVVRAAQIVAEVEPDTIGYVETHGTGTPLGDPIEMAALTRAFRAASTRRGFCAVGSVKTNIGHLDAGAGVAGLIKTVEVLRHGHIPPSLNFDHPEPGDRLRVEPVLRRRRGRRLAGRHGGRNGGAAPRRRQLVRHRRHQRPRGARGGAAGRALRAVAAAPAPRRLGAHAGRPGGRRRQPGGAPARAAGAAAGRRRLDPRQRPPRVGAPRRGGRRRRRGGGRRAGRRGRRRGPPHRRPGAARRRARRARGGLPAAGPGRPVPGHGARPLRRRGGLPPRGRPLRRRARAAPRARPAPPPLPRRRAPRRGGRGAAPHPPHPAGAVHRRVGAGGAARRLGHRAGGLPRPQPRRVRRGGARRRLQPRRRARPGRRPRPHDGGAAAGGDAVGAAGRGGGRRLAGGRRAARPGGGQRSRDGHRLRPRRGDRGAAGTARRRGRRGEAPAHLPRLPLADDGADPRRLCRGRRRRRAAAAGAPVPVQPERHLDHRRGGDRPGLLGAPPARHGALRRRPGGDRGGRRAAAAGGRPQPLAGHPGAAPARRQRTAAGGGDDAARRPRPGGARRPRPPARRRRPPVVRRRGARLGPPSSPASGAARSACPPTPSSAGATGWRRRGARCSRRRTSRARRSPATPRRPPRSPRTSGPTACRRPTCRRAMRPRSALPGCGSACWASPASAPSTTSSSSAATRCSPPRCCRGCATPSKSSCP